MKVNLQKIIVFILSLSICLSLFGIPTFAYISKTDYIYTTQSEAFLDAVNLIEAYSNGNISFEEFSSDLVYVQGKAYTSGLDVASVKIQQFIDVCNLKFGSDSSFGGSEHGGGSAGGSRTPITDIWNDVCNKNNVPTENTQTSTMDMHGYGACVVMNDGSAYPMRIYCNYVVLGSNGSDDIYSRVYYSGPYIYYSYNNKTKQYEAGVLKNTSFAMTGNSNAVNFDYYGDIRYFDGTEAPTDDEWEYDTIKNFDDMSDRNLSDLIKDLSEKLEQEYPDLSSIEGLLKAIYARLGSLDSDNDNHLLSEILTAIKAIKVTDTDNTELLELLEDIKNSLVFGDDDNKETFSEQLKKIIDNQITRDDFVIDEDMYNNHVEIVKERLLGKFSFIYNMKTFVTYCFDEYSNTSDSPEFNINYDGKSYTIDLNAFNEYMPNIQWILAAFVYLNYAYHTYRKIPSYINGGDNE